MTLKWIRDWLQRWTGATKSTNRNEAGALELSAIAVAVEALKRGDLDQALTYCEGWVPSTKLASTATFYGHLLTIQGRYDEAYTALQQALLLSPDHTAAHDALAVLYEAKDDWEMACEARLAGLATRSGPIPSKPLTASLKTLVRAYETTVNADKTKAILVTLQRYLRHPEANWTPAERQNFAQFLFRLPDCGPLALAWYFDEPISAARVTILKRHTSFAGVACPLLKNASVLQNLQWAPWLPDQKEVLEGYFTRNIRTRREDQHSPVALHRDDTLVLENISQDWVLIDEPTVLIGDIDNYYHFMLEHLGRAANLPSGLRSNSEIKWAVSTRIKPYQRTYLEHLGIGPSELLELNPLQQYHFREVWAPKPLAFGAGYVAPHLVDWFRSNFQIAPRRKNKRRLYLSRANTDRRRVVNEEELLKTLAQWGFECVNLESLPIADQIGLMMEADFIIGPTGAALTNIVFMPPHGHVIVLLPTPLARNDQLYFHTLAKAARLQCMHLCGTVAYFPSNRSIDADYRIDADLLKSHIARILDSYI